MDQVLMTDDIHCFQRKVENVRLKLKRYIRFVAICFAVDTSRRGLKRLSMATSLDDEDGLQIPNTDKRQVRTPCVKGYCRALQLHLNIFLLLLTCDNIV